MKRDNVWFLGGLSGGHMYPLFSIAKQQYNKKDNQKCHFFIPKNELIEKIVNTQIDFKFDISVLKYPKPERSWRSIFFLLYSIIIFLRILYICIFDAPLKMYSTGGYFSIPFSICAWIFSIPFYIYHLDVIPGLAGKLIGKNSNVTQCILYKETKKYLYKNNTILLVDYPIRYTVFDKKDKDEAKILLNKRDYYIIFILGGSQGSEEINDYIISIIAMIKNKKIYIVHQTGKKQEEFLIHFYKNNNIDALVFDYNNNLLDYYNSSDLIIARAGAGILAEIDFFKKNALIIPLQGFASNHQLKNVECYAKKNKLIQVVVDKKDFIIKMNRYVFKIKFL